MNILVRANENFDFLKILLNTCNVTTGTSGIFTCSYFLLINLIF